MPVNAFQSINQSLTFNEALTINQSLTISSLIQSNSTLCGLPGIDLQSINRTINFTLGPEVWYVNPCGQVQPNDPDYALACWFHGYGDVIACQVPFMQTGYTLATAGTNHNNARYEEIMVPRGVHIKFDQTGSECNRLSSPSNSLIHQSDAALRWTFDAKLICQGDRDEPVLVSMITAGTCAQTATIYSRAACRCGTPDFDMYAVEARFGPLSYSLDNTLIEFSPCGIVTRSKCVTSNFTSRLTIRASLCQTSDISFVNWLTYTPESAHWSLNVTDGVDVLTMQVMGGNSVSYLMNSYVTVNYWCNRLAVEPFIFNVSITYVPIVVIIDVALVDICIHPPADSSSSSSTGSAHIPDTAEESMRAAIVVIVLAVLSLVFIIVMCCRARRHVERWSYVEDDVVYAEYEEPMIHQPEVEIFEPQYRRVRE